MEGTLALNLQMFRLEIDEVSRRSRYRLSFKRNDTTEEFFFNASELGKLVDFFAIADALYLNDSIEVIPE